MDEQRRRHLIEFAIRDREEPARLKAAHWEEYRRRHGLEGALRISADLFAWARAVRPDWPTAEDRRQDLETHVRVGEMLRSVRTSRAR